MKKIILFSVMLVYFCTISWSKGDAESSRAQPCLVTQAGHNSLINTISFSPDGKLLASGGYDDSIRLWDVTSGALIRTLIGHVDAVYYIVFSPDGKRMATGDNSHMVKLWDVVSGKELFTLTKDNGYLNSLAFSPDGKLLASGSEYNGIDIWNSLSGEKVSSPNNNADDDGVNTIDFSPDGKILASGDDGHMIKFWDVSSWKEIKRITGAEDEYISSIKFSPDGKTLASASGKIIRQWDVSSGKEIRALSGHTDDIDYLTYSTDGKLLTSSRDKTIRLWDPLSSKIIRTFENDYISVSSFAFSLDNKILAVIDNNDNNPLRSLYFIRLLDVSTGNEIRIIGKEEELYSADSISFYANTIEAGLSNKKYITWNLNFGDDASDLTGNVSDKSMGDHSEIKQNELNTLINKIDKASIIALSPEKNILASVCSYNRRDVSSDTIKLWDVSSGKEIRSLTGHTNFVKFLTFSPDGKMLASGSYDDTIKLWDVPSGKAMRSLNVNLSIFAHIAFSPDGKLLAYNESIEDRIILFDVDSGNKIKTLTGHADNVFSIIFSPDGKLLASGSLDNTIKLWDVSSGIEIKTLTGHAGGISDIAFSPDGKILASNSFDNSIKFWNLNTYKEMLSLYVFNNSDWTVVSPDGRFDGTEGGFKNLHWVQDNIVTSLDSYYANYYTKGLLQQILSGEDEQLTRNIQNEGSRPTVEILKPSALEYNTDGKKIDLQVRVTDNGGGIDEVYLLRNNVRINAKPLNKTVTDRNTVLEFKDIILMPGANTIIAMASSIPIKKGRKGILSPNNSIEATRIINSAVPTEKPNLYILTIGVNATPKNESGNLLKYAVQDAKELAQQFMPSQGKLYSRVISKVITQSNGKDVTRNMVENAINELLAENPQPNDTFILAYSGHAYVFDDDFCLGLSDMKNDPLYGSALIKSISGINAGRKLLFLDCCYSGKIKELITNISRNVNGELSWAVSCLANSKSQEYDKLQHGVLSWCLINGLQGKANILTGNEADQYVSINELASYINMPARAKFDLKTILSFEPALGSFNGVSSDYNLSVVSK